MFNLSFRTLVPIALAGSVALGSPLTNQQNLSIKSVTLDYARYQTDVSLAEGVTSFLGIRYAAPPTGDLRFRAPVAPAAVKELQLATSQPPACWPRDPGSTTPPSEDCLYVNVHLPTKLDLASDKCEARLPILVFIHGGSYVQGSAAMYPAEKLVRDSGHKLIAINVQYRLDAFGFLAGGDVEKDGALNAGILDQKFALEWVQKNAHAFCGDSSKVTLFGHSAGAGSVLQHLIAHGGQSSNRLFKTALMSSPYLPPQYSHDDPILEDRYHALARQTNCSVDSETLSCLRSLDVQALLNASAALDSSSLFVGFSPVIDGSYILERPTLALRKGKVSADVLMVMSNTNEAVIFPFTLEETTEIYVKKNFPRLPEAKVKQAAQLYHASTPTEVEQLSTQINSEFFFVCPAYWIVDGFKERTAWKGTFGIPPSTHGLDLNYIFKDAGIYGQPVTFPNEDFGRALRNAYFGTATTSNPTAAGIVTPHWPQYSHGGAHTEMLFNKTENDQVNIHTFQTDAGLQERCNFWHSVAEYTSQ